MVWTLLLMSRYRQVSWYLERTQLHVSVECSRSDIVTFHLVFGPKAFVILKPGKTARFSITTEMRHWALLWECFQRGLTKEMRPAEVQGIKMMKRSIAEYGLTSLCSEHLAFASVAQTATVRQNQPSVLWYPRHFVTIKGKVTETSSRKVTECLHFLWF